MQVKFVSLVVSILLSTLSVFSETTTTPADVHKWNNGNLGTRIERSPGMLPSIMVTYDSEDQTIMIESSVDCEVTVKVYDDKGNLLALANSLDEVITCCGYNGETITVRIESNYWYAISVIYAQ